jgi:hypothetical protein
MTLGLQHVGAHVDVAAEDRKFDTHHQVLSVSGGEAMVGSADISLTPEIGVRNSVPKTAR